MSRVAYIVAIVAFVLAALGVDFEHVSNLQVVAVGLAAFALGHVLPD